jgi:hypothetical protein
VISRHLSFLGFGLATRCIFNLPLQVCVSLTEAEVTQLQEVVDASLPDLLSTNQLESGPLFAMPSRGERYFRKNWVEGMRMILVAAQLP